MKSTDYIPVREAAAALGRTERHLWNLIHDERLETKKEGRRRLVSQASIDKYRSENNNSEILTELHSTFQPDAAYKLIVSKILKTIPALSAPRAAARRLGIPLNHFDRLIERGSVPIVPIGSDRFIPARWLAETLSQAYGVSFIRRLEGSDR